jgi:hypothetical protein
MDSEVNNLIAQIVQRKEQDELEKIGGPGTSNFLSGLVDIPKLLSLTSKS